MKKPFVAATLLTVGAWAIGSCALVVPSAFATSSTFNGTTHCDPSAPPDPNNFACGQNPVFTGPPPSFVSIPSNCPSFLSKDNWTLDFAGGNSVAHFTANKNGFWAGGTSEGPGTLTSSDGTVEYAGHLTEWDGFGQNSPSGANQTEFGRTVTFNGSGPAGNLSLHLDVHQTFNNAGTPTSNVLNVTVSCS